MKRFQLNQAHTCVKRQNDPHFQEQLLQPIRSRSPELDTPDALADAASGPADSDSNLAFAMESALDLLGGSTQWVVAGSVGATLLQRADSATLVWVVGSLFNAVFSKVLKKGINQVRHSRWVVQHSAALGKPGMALKLLRCVY